MGKIKQIHERVIRLKSQPRWVVRCFIIAGALLGGILALVSHPIGGTHAENDRITYLQNGDIKICGTEYVSDENGAYGCITIQGKNVGATTTGACRNAPSTSYGYYFQWGDNTTGYTEQNWSSSNIQSGNAWGGENDDFDEDGWKPTNSYPVDNWSQRQGPCDEGYHVPSQGEWYALIDMWAGTKANSFIGGYYIDDFCTDFQTPFVGHRRYEDGSLESQNESVNFWSSSSSSYDDSWSFFLGEDSANAYTEDTRSWGYSVRCFKDEGEEIEEGESCEVTISHKNSYKESITLNHGEGISTYPYPYSVGPIDTCEEEYWECNNGNIVGSSRDDDEVYVRNTRFGYGSCEHNPSDNCWYYDHINHIEGVCGSDLKGVYCWVNPLYVIGNVIQGYSKINGTCEQKNYICGDGYHWYDYSDGAEGTMVSELYYDQSNCESSEGITEIEKGESCYVTVAHKTTSPDNIILPHGSGITIYPKNFSHGSTNTCEEEYWECNNGEIEGSSRGDGFGYGACEYNPDDGCGYSDAREWGGMNNNTGWPEPFSNYSNYSHGGYTKINGVCEENDYICGDGGHWYRYENGVRGAMVTDLYYYSENCEEGPGEEIEQGEEQEWNTATLVTNEDGSKTLTYSGKSYTIASGDLPGEYYWGHNYPTTDTEHGGDDEYSTYGFEYDDVWGGGSDTYIDENSPSGFGYGAGDDNREGRQGPCPDGWYVPSLMDIMDVREGWCHLSGNDCSEDDIGIELGYASHIRSVYFYDNNLASDFANDLFNVYSNSTSYWTSTPAIYLEDETYLFNYAWYFYLDRGYYEDDFVIDRNYLKPVRCFKNPTASSPSVSYIEPTDTNMQVTVGQTAYTYNELENTKTVTTNTVQQVENKPVLGEVSVSFGSNESAKFSKLVKVNIPVEDANRVIIKVKHAGLEEYNYDGLTTNRDASCSNGRPTSNQYNGTPISVVNGYVSIYTCEASSFIALGVENGGNSLITVNIAALNSGQNVCSGEDYIFPNITALPTAQTISLAKKFSCVFGNAAAKAVTLHLLGDLTDGNGNMIPGANVKLANPEWAATPTVLKDGTTIFSSTGFMGLGQTLFNKVGNKIGEAYGSGVEIEVTIPAGTPDGIYNGTIVLDF